MNENLKEIFRGKVVNKAHTINTGVDEFPRYVLEYLIENYCPEETFHEDMEKVVRRLKETFVYGPEAEKIRHHIRENRRHSVIANPEACLVETRGGPTGLCVGRYTTLSHPSGIRDVTAESIGTRPRRGL